MSEQKSDDSADRPNLVFTFADQLRLQSCGYSDDYAEDPAPYTPNIDRLADESADFRQAVSGSPICAPYRSCLFTGKYASSTGMVINELRTMPDPDAIAHVLEEHGYQTAYFGKWHLYGTENSDDDVNEFVPPGPDRLGFDGEWRAYNMSHDYYDGYYYEDEPDRTMVDGYLPQTMTDHAVSFMERASDGDRPFALFLSYGPPHDPWTWDNVPETFAHLFRDESFPDPPNFEGEGHARYWHPSMDEGWYESEWKPGRFRRRQVYAAQTASLDFEVGRLLNALDDRGLRDDTAFVFTSDHGEMFGSHGRVAKNVFYEEAIRVPFLLRYPQSVEPSVHETPLNTPDIAPTLLGLLDLPVPDSMEGADLSHVARGEDGPEPEAAFLQGMGHTYQWEDGNEWRAARDGRYTYARWIDGEELLFDTAEGPYQRENVIDDSDYCQARERLRKFVDAKLNELDDPFEPTTWYRDRWIEDRVIVRSATRVRPSTRQSQDDRFGG
jgi:arylsulfatase A-like enzyme